MHTSTSMHTEEFGITAGGAPGTIEDLLPGYDVDSRLAVVTRSPGGSLVAAPAILAAAGHFYERLRSVRDDDFYRYPGHFAVHSGHVRAFHGWLDIWPEHREVVVEPHGEAVLESLHDRAITHVILESSGPGGGDLMRENAHWFLEEIRDVLVFDPAQEDGDIVVEPSAAAAKLIIGAVEASEDVLPADVAVRLRADAARPRRFTRVSAPVGLRHLCGYGAPEHDLGQSPEYLARHGANSAIMARHRYTVT